VRTHALSNGRELIEIRCFLGAYQGETIYYLLAGNSLRGPLVFYQLESVDRGRLEHYRSAQLTGIVHADTTQGTLTVLRKYRGIGDCG